MAPVVFMFSSNHALMIARVLQYVDDWGGERIWKQDWLICRSPDNRAYLAINEETQQVLRFDDNDDCSCCPERRIWCLGCLTDYPARTSSCAHYCSACAAINLSRPDNGEECDCQGCQDQRHE